MPTATLVKRGPGRPGREVLPAVPAANRKLAARNRRIKAAWNRKRNKPTQAELAEKYGIDQSLVSQILRNPASHTSAA